jgi:hypothetical protein
MVRTNWLALASLIAICGMAALKGSIATINSARQGAETASLSEADIESDTPTTKADKLDVNSFDEAPAKLLVHTIPIVVTEPSPTPAAEKVTKIIGRHWHERYARMSRRSGRNYRRGRTIHRTRK